MQSWPPRLKFSGGRRNRNLSKIESAAKSENWNNFWKGSRGHQGCSLENTAFIFSTKFQKLSRIFLKIWMTLLSSWNVFWKSCSGHVECGLEVHAGTFSKNFQVFNAELPKKVKNKTKYSFQKHSDTEMLLWRRRMLFWHHFQKFFFGKSVINFCSSSEVVRTVSAVFEKKNCPKKFV